MRRSIFAVILTVAALSVASAAEAARPGGADSPPVASGPAASDPWEHLNRRGFAIHQFLDKCLLRPAAMLYRALTPGPIGKGLHNVITNLSEPLVFINDVLQVRVRRAARTTVRFAFNSTFGLGGLIDVAGHGGIPHHASTFGDTLGRYGVGPGPYLFLPLIGPSTVRDLVGLGFDTAADPVHWLSYPYRSEISASAAVVGGLDTRAEADDQLKAILSDAADPYATLRSVYLQYRQGEIDGERPGAALPPLPEIDSPSPPPPAPAPQSPPPSPEKASLVETSGKIVLVRRPLYQTVAFESLPDQ